MLLAVAALAAACDFGARAVGAGRERIAVHAVLDPGRYAQTILVERTLTGAAAPAVTHYDPDDPIVSAGGLPVSDALVMVIGPSDTAVAVEDLASRGDGKGAGVYRFFNADPGGGAEDVVRLTPGATYELRVATPDGRTVTGTTTIPGATPVYTSPANERFNRDHDSLFVFWPEASGAARYAVRIETPRGPFETFVDSAEYLVSGSLRHTGVEGLPRVFVPGFRQSITVGAVDRSYFDYYRSASSPYTGRGLITHLEGGVGVFGSYVQLLERSTDVTADLDEPFEGSYVPAIVPAGAPRQFTLYLDAIDGAFGRLSGSWPPLAGPPTAGIIGTLRGDYLSLAFLAGATSADTVFTLQGRLLGGSIEGTLFPGGDRVSYRQQ